MTDVFISYARENRVQAAELSRLLEEAGYTVWWDWNLVGGANYRAIIAAKLKEARKVLVLWSKQSVASSFVIDEAQEARDAGKLIPISIDNARPPMGFRDLHTLRVETFRAVSETILAAIEGRGPAQDMRAARAKPRRTWMIAGGALVLALAIAAVAAFLFLGRGSPTVEPSYSVYNSAELGVTAVFPINILSLDTTERAQRKLSLRDGSGQRVVTISRTSLPEQNDVKVARDKEADELRRLGYTLTYIAPERDKNWANWYVLSGLANGTVFYYRRWFSDDSVVSMEFAFPKAQGALYEKLIPTMTREFAFNVTSPKTRP